MDAIVIINCHHCGKEVTKRLAHYNRTKKMGNNSYCNIQCSGKGQRTTKADKIEVKRLYDIKYRKENKAILDKKKADFFKKDYAENPEKYKNIRKKRYKKHLKYLQTPEYKVWKKEYDKNYRAKKEYGEYWESYLLIKKIQKEYDNREVKASNKLITKSQKRKKLW